MQPAFLSAIQMKGLEFIELATPDAAPLAIFLESMGFTAIARHRHKPVTLYRMGHINLIVNSASTGAVHDQAVEQGVSICAIAIRVDDAQEAYQSLINAGAWEAETQAGVMELNIPAIEGVGGTHIYLIDRFDDRVSIYDIDFMPLDGQGSRFSVLADDNAACISSLTLAVANGREQQWNDFFVQLLGFSLTGTGVISQSGLAVKVDGSELSAGADIGDEYYSAITFKISSQTVLEKIGAQGDLTFLETEDDNCVQVRLPATFPSAIVWRFEVAA